MSTLAKTRPHEAGASSDLVGVIDFVRLDAARTLDPGRQAEMGQFMTPPPIARLMASMFEARRQSLRLLDAGAGVGSLTAAWVAEICSRKRRPKQILVTAYEIDPSLAGRLHATLEACRDHCERGDVSFAAEVRREDFVAAGVEMLGGGLFAPKPESYDCAILNPPYRKIHSDSRTRRLLEILGAETTNLYTAFLSLAVGLLEPGGELVAITPRSFCNGTYFRPFRRIFLDSMVLRRFHSFETRDRAFGDDEVLQENIIVHAVKRPAKQAQVVISSTDGPDDPWPTWRAVDARRIVKDHDPDQFIHLPVDPLSEAVEQCMEVLTASLEDLGLEVSTGRVVDFRAEEHLRTSPEPGAVPLIYPGHFADGYVQWPRNGTKKPNALALTAETQELVVPRGHYVLVKRFTAKEERRRVVAAVCDPNGLPDSGYAFENHLNYFHAHGRPLSQDLAKGLAAFLNSTLVDSHFREWSGHTQVNAGDLRRLRYPSREQLLALGTPIGPRFPDQDEIDRRAEGSLPRPVSLRRYPDPVKAKRRVQEALFVLKELGLPREQQNDRSALTLLALLDLRPKMGWAEAKSPLRGITEMMGFFAKQYGRTYAPNSRETVRRYTVHQFVQAGLAIPNPDKPSRPTNSPKAVYQIAPSALDLLRTFGTAEWEGGLRAYLGSVESLQIRYAGERAMKMVPVTLPSGVRISLSRGDHNVLAKSVIEEFCPRFTPGATLLYVGDTADKWAHFDEPPLKALGIAVDLHGKMPDVVIHHAAKNWLVLVEAVASHGPVSAKRRAELQQLFRGAKAALVFVTAFLTRRDLIKYLGDISWETEVWVAESPSHLIHFDGQRFLGPT